MPIAFYSPMHVLKANIINGLVKFLQCFPRDNKVKFQWKNPQERFTIRIENNA